MSYVRAIEGETNSQVLDPAFHRNVQPPSQARELRTTGIPTPPVSSVNRPQMFSFPRPASPTATSDLRGQAHVNVAVAPAVRRQGNVISAERSAAISQQRRDRQRAVQVLQQRRRQSRGMSGLGVVLPEQASSVAVLATAPSRRVVPGSVTPENRGIGPAVQLLLAARPVKRRGMSGLGEVTFPLPPAIPGIIGQQIEAAVQAPVLGAKLASTGVLTGEEAKLFSMLPIAQQQLYVRAAQSIQAPATTGVLDQITQWFTQQTIAGVPNVALVAAGGLFVILLATKKKR